MPSPTSDFSSPFEPAAPSPTKAANPTEDAGNDNEGGIFTLDGPFLSLLEDMREEGFARREWLEGQWVKKEQRVIEDARRLVEHNAAAQRYTAQVLQMEALYSKLDDKYNKLKTK